MVLHKSWGNANADDKAFWLKSKCKEALLSGKCPGDLQPTDSMLRAMLRQNRNATVFAVTSGLLSYLVRGRRGCWVLCDVVVVLRLRLLCDVLRLIVMLGAAIASSHIYPRVSLFSNFVQSLIVTWHRLHATVASQQDAERANRQRHECFTARVPKVRRRAPQVCGG